MKTALLFALMIFLSLTCYAPAAELGSEGDEAIEHVKLKQESLPAGMEITKEILADKKQIHDIRMRVGFPLRAILNQTIIYETRQAQVNYMVLPGKEWVDFGYSNLLHGDGDKSLVFEKEGVLIQMAATKKELEDTLVLLLRVERLQRLRIMHNRLPGDWVVVSERFMKPEELREAEYKSGARIRRGIIQDMMINRRTVKLKYYDCYTEQSADMVGRGLAEIKTSMVKILVESSGSIVVAAESAADSLNEYVMSFVNW